MSVPMGSSARHRQAGRAPAKPSTKVSKAVTPSHALPSHTPPPAPPGGTDDRQPSHMGGVGGFVRRLGPGGSVNCSRLFAVTYCPPWEGLPGYGRHGRLFGVVPLRTHARALCARACVRCALYPPMSPMSSCFLVHSCTYYMATLP
jgi:hypothetical protein